MGESTHRKGDPDQIVNEIVDMVMRSGRNSSVNQLETALSHVPMNWQGGRQSSNIQDLRGPQAIGQIEELFSQLTHLGRNRVIPKGTARQLFPLPSSSPAPIGFANKVYPPTQFTPDAIRLLDLIGVPATDENLERIFGPED